MNRLQSNLRRVCGCRGIYLSLANALLREMGVHEPRTALARVEVNGDSLGDTLVRKWGRVTADFETTFQLRLPADWFTNGVVEFHLELDGQPRPFTRAGISVSRGFDSRQTNKLS